MQVSRRRFWIATVLAAASALLGLLTLVWQTWIEGASGLEPDGGSGELEWLIVAGCAVASLAFSGLARREWVRMRTVGVAR
ncbi:ABC transporter permease [Nocardioides jejuensis]|uniref:ABC transporter permease n=1 Tax=Nocardioides jejuensis TaxID=2502782 RepID=A0A4R1CF84_9ACTN|nr:ABC transporter permease [Nocardioides jejuensis]